MPHCKYYMQSKRYVFDNKCSIFIEIQSIPIKVAVRNKTKLIEQEKKEMLQLAFNYSISYIGKQSLVGVMTIFLASPFWFHNQCA